MAAPTDELDLKMHQDPVTEMITRLCISVRLSTGGPGESFAIITQWCARRTTLPAPAFPEISKLLFFLPPF